MRNSVELAKRQSLGLSTHMFKASHHRFDNKIALIFLNLIGAFARNFNIKFGIIQNLRGIHIANIQG